MDSGKEILILGQSIRSFDWYLVAEKGYKAIIWAKIYFEHPQIKRPHCGIRTSAFLEIRQFLGLDLLLTICKKK